METKKQIRAAVLKRRTELPDFSVREKSRRIADSVAAHPWFREATCVLVYIDFRKEVSTREIIERCWSQGKQVYVPRVEGRAMQFCRVRSWDDVKPGTWGILEPEEPLEIFRCEDRERARETLAIMPGVAFDERRGRIGYGGGYYDRYFEKHECIRKIALAFECQMVEETPSEETDIRPDCIVTEARVIEGV